jgi:cytochrome c oxidase subunit 2
MRHGRSLFAAGVLALVGALLVAVIAPEAWANEPKAWQLGMQSPASPTKEFIHHFHDFLLVVITLITLFVLGLLGYVVVRFSAKNNPTPSKTTHNTLIEVVWTVVPVMILVVIAIPSFKLLYYGDKTQEAEMTIKVVGNQWYWQYQYPDMGEFTIDSRMIEDKDLPKGGKRLLEVDNRLVLPVNTTVRILLVSNDVMHSWMVSSLGVQLYTNPEIGRAHV